MPSTIDIERMTKIKVTRTEDGKSMVCVEDIKALLKERNKLHFERILGHRESIVAYDGEEAIAEGALKNINERHSKREELEELEEYFESLTRKPWHESYE